MRRAHSDNRGRWLDPDPRWAAALGRTLATAEKRPWTRALILAAQVLMPLVLFAVIVGLLALLAPTVS